MPASSRLPIVCPVCGKELEPEQIHALHEGSSKAIERLQQQYKDELAAREAATEGRIRELEQRRKDDLKRLEEERKEAMKQLREQNAEALEELKRQMSEIQHTQIEALKEAHTKSTEQLNQELTEIRAREEAWKTEREALRKEGEEALSHLKEEVAAKEKAAAEKARQVAQDELSKKDQRIKELEVERGQFEHQVEQLREAARRSPSDVIGTAGEFLLKETLQAAFEKDLVEKVSRPGRKSADLVQRIARTRGEYAATVIAYDNKVGKKVTARDLSAARGYREIHNTDYVIIVTDEMPAEAGDRLVWESQGILVVKRAALLDLVRVLRDQIVKIDQARAAGKDRGSKEARLFDYISGDAFNRNLRRLLALDVKEMTLLETEKRSHANIWKQREQIHREREEAVAQVESSTAAILEKESEDSGVEIEHDVRLIEAPLPQKKRKLPQAATADQ